MNFKEANKEADRIPRLVSVSIEETGPARAAFKVVQQDKNRSRFTYYIALTSGGKCVEVYSEIEWQNLCTMAKHRFSFTCSNKQATFDLGLGAIKRGNMSEKLFEVPAQKWADITDESGEYGVSVISECKYGWDKFSDDTLRLTVLHTPRKNYRIDSMQSMMDIGLNRYSFAIFSHAGEDLSATQLEARKFVQPLTAYACAKHAGALGSAYSFGSVSSNQVILRAVKKAEDSEEIVVRLNEGAGSALDKFTLSLGESIESAREIYASEEPLGDAVVEDGKLVASFTPYQIRSFALTLKKSGVQAQKPVSKPAQLEFDKNVITSNGQDTGDFEKNIPRELIPNVITANGVDFEIAKTDKNACVMKGQTVKISEGTDKLCLLCASFGSDKNVTFDVDGATVTKTVLSATESFAGWDLPDLGDVAFVKHGKLGWEATHSHTNGRDNIVKGLCFYIVELDVKGKDSVILPVDQDVVVIAATEVKNKGGKIVSKTFDEVDEDRVQTFYMTFGEFIRYCWYKCVWNLNDKGEFITAINRGRKK